MERFSIHSILLLAFILLMAKLCVSQSREKIKQKKFTRVIQLGDSYSAGTGTLKAKDSNLELCEPTDLIPAKASGKKVCCFNNKSQSPGYKIASDLGLSDKFTMLACFGATTSSFKELQLASIPDAATGKKEKPLVVLTLGGNDMKLSRAGKSEIARHKRVSQTLGKRTEEALSGDKDVMHWGWTMFECALENCGSDTAVTNFDEIEKNLIKVFKLLVKKFEKSKATIRIMGYPSPVANAYKVKFDIFGFGRRCWAVPIYYTAKEADLFDSFIVTLNRRVESAVEIVKDNVRHRHRPDIEFVDVSKEFAGGGICLYPNGKYLNDPSIDIFNRNPLNFFHPNKEGWNNYYKALSENLS